MPDFALLRQNMVESQVRTSEVTDRRVIRAMLTVPRELFVPVESRPLAYMDGPVVLGRTAAGLPARQLMAPMTAARLLTLADLAEGERVLEVGCATGYLTAIIAHMAKSAVGLEVDETLAGLARKSLAELSLGNAKVVTGPLEAGAAAEGPFDAVIVSGTVPELPAAYLAQVRPGGRLVAIIAEAETGRAMRFERHGQGWSRRFGFDASAAQLPGFARKREFAL